MEGYTLYVARRDSGGARLGMLISRKHSTRAVVRIDHEGDLLVVEVGDDGQGGADPAGTGLTGLRKRVEALDGTLRIASPAGGPTLLHAEIPCAP